MSRPMSNPAALAAAAATNPQMSLGLGSLALALNSLVVGLH